MTEHTWHSVQIKAQPLQMVYLEPLSCKGRVVSVRLVAGGNAWYSVDYFLDGQLRNAEVHGDDITVKEPHE